MNLELKLKDIIKSINKEINREYTTQPVSNEDLIRRNAYCYGLQKVLFKLEEIIERSE